MTIPTIAALATGRPPAAIAVIRLSGPAARASVAALTGGAALPPARRLSVRALSDPRDASRLDTAMVAIFPGPASATGEDLAEFHLHGGPAVIAGVLAALTSLPDVRLAQPGEFTRRAFANGRLDLAQVEGLADLIAAETQGQRRQALELAGGALSRAAAGWRETCLALLAEAEAALDFAEDEADVAERLATATTTRLRTLADQLDALLADAARGARLRDGLTIVVAGPPNVGKSSLVNRLAERDVAIVTPHAGTTRDPIEVPLDLDGLAAVLIDTAGLRDTDDPIEREGVARARARAAAADLVLHVTDCPDPTAPPSGLLIVNKIDLHEPAMPPGAWGVSALRGDGIAALRQELARWATSLLRSGEPALLTHERHRAEFSAAGTALHEAATAADPVIRAECLRAAANALGRIAGRVGVEDVLDRIFSRFCIGK